MRQSTITFATILFLFVVYITARGQLPAYLALFTKKQSASNSPSGASDTIAKTQQNAQALTDELNSLFSDFSSDGSSSTPNFFGAP